MLGFILVSIILSLVSANDFYLYELRKSIEWRFEEISEWTDGDDNLVFNLFSCHLSDGSDYYHLGGDTAPGGINKREVVIDGQFLATAYSRIDIVLIDFQAGEKLQVRVNGNVAEEISLDSEGIEDVTECTNASLGERKSYRFEYNMSNLPSTTVSFELQVVDLADSSEAKFAYNNFYFIANDDNLEWACEYDGLVYDNTDWYYINGQCGVTAEQYLECLTLNSNIPPHSMFTRSVDTIEEPPSVKISFQETDFYTHNDFCNEYEIHVAGSDFDDDIVEETTQDEHGDDRPTQTLTLTKEQILDLNCSILEDETEIKHNCIVQFDVAFNKTEQYVEQFLLIYTIPKDDSHPGEGSTDDFVPLWACDTENDAGEPDLLTTYYYNGNCLATADFVEQCLLSVLDMGSDPDQDPYQLNTYITDDITVSELVIEYQNQPLFYTHESDCSEISLTINELDQEFEELVQENNTGLPVQTIQKVLSAQDIIDLGCESEINDELVQTIYTCPVVFEITSNFTVHYEKSFNLIASIYNEGALVSASLVLDLNTPPIVVDNEDNQFGLSTNLLICGSGDYTEGTCENIEATLDNPYTHLKNEKLTLRHKVVQQGHYTDSYTLNLLTFKTGPMNMMEQITETYTGPGFIDFTFIPKFAGELIQFEVASEMVALGTRRRVLEEQDQQEIQKGKTNAFVSVLDQQEYDLYISEQQKKNDQLQSQNQKQQQQTTESGNNNTGIYIGVIVGLIVLVVTAILGSWLYVRSQKNKQLQESVQSKQMQQMQKYQLEKEGGSNSNREIENDQVLNSESQLETPV